MVEGEIERGLTQQEKCYSSSWYLCYRHGLEVKKQVQNEAELVKMGLGWGWVNSDLCWFS